MNRKVKNTLLLFGILLIIAASGGVYNFVYQRSRIKKQVKQIEDLNKNMVKRDDLVAQLTGLHKKALVLDSILSARKFIIPKQLTQTYFYDFVSRISYGFSPLTRINIEYQEQKPEKAFSYYSYKVFGIGEFNDIYKLVYAVEQSKELKKVKALNVTATVLVENDMPHHLVNYSFIANVYFAKDDRFSTSKLVENKLEPADLYNCFYPLVRNELPPNSESLADVTTAKLLAIVPDGAFISDSKGNTFMLMEGDPVYLGYLTKIDYDLNQVTFILNKGGIIEKVFLKLEKEDNRKKVK